MVGGEGPAHRRVVDLAEEMHTFRRRDRHIVHLGQNRFPVQIFQQQQNTAFGRVVADPLQPVDRGLHPDGLAGGEVIAAMNDDPLRTNLRGKVDIGFHVGIHRIAAKGGYFGDIHAGQGMQPEIDAACLEKLAHAGAARIIECLEGVWRDVGLRIDHPDAMFRRPADAVLQREATPQINPDTVFQAPAGHRRSPSIWRPCAAGISFR